MAHRSRSNQPSSPNRDGPIYDRTPRNTFRVARAQRVIAEALPDLVTLRGDQVKRDAVATAARRSQVGAAPLSRLQLSQFAEPQKRPERVEPEPLRLDDPKREAPTCKARPERSKGSGGSRAFVPWCNRK